MVEFFVQTQTKQKAAAVIAPDVASGHIWK